MGDEISNTMMNRKVEVYRNLHKKCWSVRNNSTGHVLWHCTEVLLKDVDLVVRPAGRAKVRREKRKNVHAFAKGKILYTSVGNNLKKIDADKYMEKFKQIVYDPYQYESFVYEDSKEPIFKADTVYLDNKGEVYVY